MWTVDEVLVNTLCCWRYAVLGNGPSALRESGKSESQYSGGNQDFELVSVPRASRLVSR